MKAPFTSEQFFSVFTDYNLSVFPMQIFFLFIGVLALLMINSFYTRKDYFIGIYLGILWLWAGAVYHIGFFSQLNKPAFVFGALFIIQALLIMYELLIRKSLRFSIKRSSADIIGFSFILFGLLIYPLLSWLSHGEPNHIISAGLPCPTTITTIGFLILNKEKSHWYLYIIPGIWAIIGISAAINFGVYQDFMMLISVISWVFIERIKRKSLKNLKVETAVKAIS